MGVEVISFGCRLNFAESALMRRRAAEAGLADATLVNTCAVTAEAVRQARQAIRRARRAHPGRPVIVSGCAAQIEPRTFADMAEVDRVLGNAEKLTAAGYMADDLASSGAVGIGAGVGARIRVADISALRPAAVEMPHDPLAAGPQGRVRAFVETQNGCDHRCTFCVIPYGRGASRSVAIDTVVAQVRRLVAGGYPEIVLTGVDITAYGADLPGAPRLGALVQTILKQAPELRRLRLSSLDPVEVDAELMRAIREEERLMPHLHLSLQSGDDLILKRMKRRHTRGDMLRFCDDVRRARPGVALAADLIAGFPTETEEMFANTLSAIEDCGLSSLHVFPFSARPRTPAARMPQLPRVLVKDRAARLRAAGEAASAKRLAAEVGTVRAVLVEQQGLGRTEHFIPVALDRGQIGEVIRMAISAAGPRLLHAQPLEERPG